MRTPINIVPLDADLLVQMKIVSQLDGGHCARGATHVFLREKEVVGAVSLFVPTAMFWARTDLHPRESLDLVKRCRAMGLEKEPNFLCACAVDSPFRPLMPAIGFELVENADYFRPSPPL